jgi:hypothetical protein
MRPDAGDYIAEEMILNKYCTSHDSELRGRIKGTQ